MMITLDPVQLEQLAEQIAARLADQHRAPMLVTADELAAALGVDVKSVYRHADELGAIRIGRRIRFDRATALAAHQAEPVTASTPARPRRTSTTPSSLLPVGRRR